MYGQLRINGPQIEYFFFVKYSLKPFKKNLVQNRIIGVGEVHKNAIDMSPFVDVKAYSIDSSGNVDKNSAIRHETRLRWVESVKHVFPELREES